MNAPGRLRGTIKIMYIRGEIVVQKKREEVCVRERKREKKILFVHLRINS